MGVGNGALGNGVQQFEKPADLFERLRRAAVALRLLDILARYEL